MMVLMNPPKLITIQGSARGGKGTLARALEVDLSSTYKVHKIDQGLKFRILAASALEHGIDKEDLDTLAEFIGRDTTREEVVSKLVEASAWSKEQLEAMYYTQAISNASGMAGKLPVTHDVVVALLLDEIRAVAKDFDIIIVDGRALQAYGKQLASEGVVEYLLAIDVHCDAFVSAQRETKIFTSDNDAEAESYTPEQTMQLLIATRDIARRNSSDARRSRDPSLPIRGAYDFDVLHEMDETEKEWVYEAIHQNGAISIDNSNTRTPESLTTPVIALVAALIRSQ
jgi:cytidylate kinase